MTPGDVGHGLAERGDEAVHGLGVDRERGCGPDDVGPGLRRQEPARHAALHHRSRPPRPDGRADQQTETASRILEAGAADGLVEAPEEPLALDPGVLEEALT